MLAIQRTESELTGSKGRVETYLEHILWFRVGWRRHLGRPFVEWLLGE